jgi:hypothetical protein
MHPDEAEHLIRKNQRYADVLFPYLIGQDINSHPNFAASRWVINFHDWPEERARQYPECYEQVLRLVKPERDRNQHRQRRDIWWRFTRPTVDLYRRVASLDRVIVITLVSKTVMPVMVPTGQVFAHKLGVFATDDFAALALLSSAIHYWWTIRQSSTMKTDANYSPSDVFETLPFPTLTDDLREAGAQLDSYRREVMTARQSGLTKTYSLLFDPQCNDRDIEELRRIHRAIDEATVQAYGWQERIDAIGGLDHGFHPVGREIRYTIGPAAQREILDSLLELNHERYADEVARGLHAKRRRAGRRRAGEQGDLGLT